MSVEDVILRLVVAWACVVQAVLAVDRPNIVIVMADDLGWNDVSFHGSNQIQTPNIDALAYNGIILNSHYVPALCTPSRASFLTGKYPTSMGMQHLVILAPEPWGLPLKETLMSQHLKRHGYATHAIGKWHLGFHEKEYTPIYRGFDSHFGYWNGFQDYYDHTMQSESLRGYDMRRGLSVDHESKGKYSTDAFTDEAVNIIENHNSTQGPLFLYLAHLAPHAGNPDQPFQAPEEEVAKHSHITDLERRIYAAMVSKVDESLGRVVSALREKDMLENSIILFMSDNGAVTFGMHSNRGSNYPLRGLKESPWEGGVRGVAAVWSPLLNRTGRVSNQLMHMADWLPTLYSAAGLNVSELGAIDGVDMWATLSENLECPRTEVFNNYDEIENYSSLRVDSWKYIAGTAQAGDVDLWYGESGEDGGLNYDLDGVLQSHVNVAIRGVLKDRGEGVQNPQETFLNLRGDSIITCDYATFSSFALITDNHNETDDKNEAANSVSRPSNGLINLSEAKEEIISELASYLQYPLGGVALPPLDRANLETLIESGHLRNAFKCDPLKMVCLFNLEKDPCERVNLARIFPALVKALEGRLKELKAAVVKPLNKPDDPFSNPAFHNGTWANWRDVRKEKDSQVKMMMESATVAFYVDHFFTVLPENVFALFPDSFQATYFLFLQLVERFFWLVTLLVCAVTVLYAVASLRKVVEPQGDPARKKSWTNWENLTFRSITNPASQSDVGRSR